MAPGPSGFAMCLASETGLAPGGAPWRRRSNSVLRSRISPKPSCTAFHAASGLRARATSCASCDIALLPRELRDQIDAVEVGVRQVLEHHPLDAGPLELGELLPHLRDRAH